MDNNHPILKWYWWNSASDRRRESYQTAKCPDMSRMQTKLPEPQLLLNNLCAITIPFWKSITHIYIKRNIRDSWQRGWDASWGTANKLHMSNCSIRSLNWGESPNWLSEVIFCGLRLRHSGLARGHLMQIDGETTPTLLWGLPCASHRNSLPGRMQELFLYKKTLLFYCRGWDLAKDLRTILAEKRVHFSQ